MTANNFLSYSCFNDYYKCIENWDRKAFKNLYNITFKSTDKGYNFKFCENSRQRSNLSRRPSFLVQYIFTISFHNNLNHALPIYFFAKKLYHTIYHTIKVHISGVKITKGASQFADNCFNLYQKDIAIPVGV